MRPRRQRSPKPRERANDQPAWCFGPFWFCRVLTLHFSRIRGGGRSAHVAALGLGQARALRRRDGRAGVRRPVRRAEPACRPRAADHLRGRPGQTSTCTATPRCSSPSALQSTAGAPSLPLMKGWISWASSGPFAEHRVRATAVIRREDAARRSAPRALRRRAARHSHGSGSADHGGRRRGPPRRVGRSRRTMAFHIRCMSRESTWSGLLDRLEPARPRRVRSE